MAMLLDGKAAIVTGGASRRGLGRAIATLFAEHGARVAILDLDGAGAAAAIADLPPVAAGAHHSAALDVTDKSACDRAVADALAALGRLDVLVNNAGITSPQRVMDVTPESYDAVMDVNIRGTVYMTQAAIPTFRAQRSGAIVNMSSVSAQRGGGVFGGSHYAAAKAAILGYTKACARELAGDNVRANAICPGFIDTDITAGKLTPERRAQIVADIPMQRAGDARDVAGCALFLASDLSAYVTGSEIDVNGGSLIH